MSLALRQRLVDVAVAQVGLKEQPGTPNVGPQVARYQEATWLTPGPWPWCAAFVAWCVRQWLVAPDVRRALNLQGDLQAEAWRCRDARAFGWEDWAAKKGLRVMDETQLAKLGDIITFDFSHIGIVTADEIDGQPLKTVEGNTNGEGSRDGDGVYLKLRKDSLTRKYIRLLP